MISVTDLVKLLEQLPVWKKVVGMQAELEALKRRVELLEKSASTLPKRDECPKCHGLDFRLDRTVPDPLMGDVGVQRHYFRCGSCSYEKYAQET